MSKVDEGAIVRFQSDPDVLFQDAIRADKQPVAAALDRRRLPEVIPPAVGADRPRRVAVVEPHGEPKPAARAGHRQCPEDCLPRRLPRRTRLITILREGTVAQSTCALTSSSFLPGNGPLGSERCASWRRHRPD